MLVSQMRKVGLASSRENRAQTWTRALSSRGRVERLPRFSVRAASMWLCWSARWVTVAVAVW